MKQTDSRNAHGSVYPQHVSTAGCQSIHNLFEEVWNKFLDPFFSSKSKVRARDAAEAIALMQQRIRELINSGPEGKECALSLLRYNIKRAKKHSAKKRMKLEAFERHLGGDL
jgi:hypothetical protein